MKNILNERNTWHPFAFKKCVKIATILLSLLLLPTSINSETVTTGNILTNSTFGTGTTYSTDGWTVSEGTHGGWSSTLSSDLWFWNAYENTVTLKQTITGSDGSTSTNQRVIVDTGCGSNNCGQFTNYSDTYIQGTNTQTDFDIKVDVSNTNNRSGHWGADIDDVELNVSYTKYEPITEEIQEIFDEIDQIDFEYEDVYFDEPVFEDEFFWEEPVFEDEFFEEEFETISLEEFADEFTDEIMDEVLEEEPANKQIVQEDEEEIIEEEAADEETEVAENTSEEEPTEKIEDKNEPIDTPEEETETKILTEEKEIEVVENQDNKLDIKLNDNIKIDVKQISLFDSGNELVTYKETNFYQPKNIYKQVDSNLFIQADLSIYNQGIYLNIGLDTYISTDPIGKHTQELYNIRVQKLELMIELNKLKELL